MQHINRRMINTTDTLVMLLAKKKSIIFKNYLFVFYITLKIRSNYKNKGNDRVYVVLNIHTSISYPFSSTSLSMQNENRLQQASSYVSSGRVPLSCLLKHASYCVYPFWIADASYLVLAVSFHTTKPTQCKE